MSVDESLAFVYIHITHFSDDTIVDTVTNLSKRNKPDFNFHHSLNDNL